MSRNKMYDEILTNLKNEFATVDFATYGLSDNEKILYDKYLSYIIVYK